MKREFSSVSVVGGWQTALTDASGEQYRFGPTFNACQDWWDWQGANLPAAPAPVSVRPSSKSQDLTEAAAPDDVAPILRRVGDAFANSGCECAANWQDKNAGRPWTRMAKVLQRAADQCERIAREV